MTLQGATKEQIKAKLGVSQPSQQPEKWLFSRVNDKMNKYWADFGVGVLTGINKWLWNVSSFLVRQSDRFLPWDQARVADRIQEWANIVTNSIEDFYGKHSKYWPVDKDSSAQAVGEFASNFIGWGALAKGAMSGLKLAWLAAQGSKIAGIANAAGKAAPYVQKAGQFLKWGTLAGKVANSALVWAGEMAGYDVVSQGKIDKGNLAMWAAFGGAIPMVWAGLNKAKNFITQALPKWLISRWLTTPSALKNASERLSRLADNGVIDIDSAPQWMLDKGLNGSKKDIQSQLVKIIKESWSQKASMLSSYNKPIGWQPITDMQKAMREILPNYAKITKKWVVPKAGNDDLVKEILGFVKQKNPNLASVERARVMLWNMGIFNKSGELADSATKEWLQKIWINTSKYLDNLIPWYRKVNKDIEVAQALAKAIWLKEAQDSARQILSLTNIMSGGTGATFWYMQTGDIKWAIQYWAYGLAGKALLNNTWVTTRSAQALKKIWSRWLTKSGKAIKWVAKRWAKTIAPAISNKKDE